MTTMGKNKRGLWLSRKVDKRTVFVRTDTVPASTFKSLPEIWGVRFDIESGLKCCRQSL
jgi:hypothetical protein